MPLPWENRLKRLLREDRQVRQCSNTDSHWNQIVSRAKRPFDFVRNTCRVFGERPCFFQRDSTRCAFHALTFNEVFNRVEALVGGMQWLGLRSGDFVLLSASPSIDWMVVEFACMATGVITVPTSPHLSPSNLKSIRKRFEIEWSFIDGGVQNPALERLLSGGRVTELGATLERSEFSIDHLSKSGLEQKVRWSNGESGPYCVHFTSGSNGEQRAVSIHHDWCRNFFAKAARPRPVPCLTLGYLPLHHLMGKAQLYKAFFSGGQTFFSTRSDTTSLLEDLRDIRPTSLALVPRVVHALWGVFQACRTGDERVDPMERMREIEMGGRLCEINLGGAPTAPALVNFLQQCYQAHLHESYGSTELGSIAVNGRVRSWLRYKLVDRPELGYRTSDKPFPRGELAVQSSRGAPVYFGESETNRAAFDEDGFVLTGDIVEEYEDGMIRWLDRSNAVVKLSHGKFVQLSLLEENLAAASSLIDQIYLQPASHGEYLLAVIVPSSSASRGGSLHARLEAEIRRLVEALNLSPHEAPRGFLIELVPFGQSNQLLSSTHKPRRGKLKARYKDMLERLREQLDGPRKTQSRPLETSNKKGKIKSVICQVLGLDPSSLPDTVSLRQVGGDSMAAVRTSHLLKEYYGMSVSAGALLSRGVNQLGECESPSSEKPKLDTLWEKSPVVWAQQQYRPVQSILVTGANGFLGRNLCLEIARQLPKKGHLFCLVRASGQQAAEEKMASAFMSRSACNEWKKQLSFGRITVVAGDIEKTRLGLAEQRYSDLAEAVDTVVHAGALVNHEFPYQELFLPNVRGTAEVLALALEKRKKPCHFISSKGLTKRLPSLKEEDTPSQVWRRRTHLGEHHAAGYIKSKLAGECLLEQAHREHGLPVTITRCNLLLPHREFPGEYNPADSLNRMLWGLIKTGIAPDSFYKAGGEFPLSGLPVDLVTSTLSRLCLEECHAFMIFHADVQDSDNGFGLDTLVQDMERFYLLRRLPYPDFKNRYFQELRLPVHRSQYSPLAQESLWQKPRGLGVRAHFSTHNFDELVQRYQLDTKSLDTSQREAWIRAIASRAQRHV